MTNVKVKLGRKRQFILTGAANVNAVEQEVVSYWKGTERASTAGFKVSGQKY